MAKDIGVLVFEEQVCIILNITENGRHTSIHICKPLKPTHKPKLAKEYAFPDPDKKQKISPLKKNKTLLAHSPKDKNIMTEQVENNKGMSLDKKEGQLVTKAICNKGFRGNSSILPCINFGVGGQESSPQSLTAYSLNRYFAVGFIFLHTQLVV
jgi:hypothetical protein